jgi:hypothetical protein
MLMAEMAKKSAQLIQPDGYPQMMNRQDAAHAMRVLRSAQTSVKAQVMMESFMPDARAGVMAQVAALEAAAGDIAGMSLAAHEIRGLAEPAGLRAAGRITDVLCRYLDEAQAQGRAADKAVVQLHVSAILRATYAEDEGRANCDAIVSQLSQLVARKLAERVA